MARAKLPNWRLQSDSPPINGLCHSYAHFFYTVYGRNATDIKWHKWKKNWVYVSHPTPSVSRCEASSEGPRMRSTSEEKIPLFITSVFLTLREPCCFGCWNTNSLQGGRRTRRHREEMQGEKSLEWVRNYCAVAHLKDATLLISI